MSCGLSLIGNDNLDLRLAGPPFAQDVVIRSLRPDPIVDNVASLARPRNMFVELKGLSTFRLCRF